MLCSSINWNLKNVQFWTNIIKFPTRFDELWQLVAMTMTDCHNSWNDRLWPRIVAHCGRSDSRQAGNWGRSNSRIVAHCGRFDSRQAGWKLGSLGRAINWSSPSFFHTSLSPSFSSKRSPLFPSDCAHGDHLWSLRGLCTSSPNCTSLYFNERATHWPQQPTRTASQSLNHCNWALRQSHELSFALNQTNGYLDWRLLLICAVYKGGLLAASLSC